jgi:guanyl-specific ribonuclease Sa
MVTRAALPADLKEVVRQMVDRHNSGRAYPGLNYGVYANEGGHGSVRLPPARKNQQYYEGRVGEDQAGQPGVYRIVMLFDDNTNQILAGYYTRDHYVSFVQFQ